MHRLALAGNFHRLVIVTHLNDVNRVTPDVVKEAVKANKSDPIYPFSSYAMKHILCLRNWQLGFDDSSFMVM